MTEKYLTRPEAVKKYGLNDNRFQLAIRRAATNGLYKVIHRKRTRLYFRQDYLEVWLKENEAYMSAENLNSGIFRPRSSPKSIRSQKKQRPIKRSW